MKRLSILLLIISALLLTACSHSEKVKPAPLTEFQQTVAVKPVWKTDTGAGAQGSGFTLEPVLEDNVIYTADIRGIVTATDTRSGRPIWRVNTRLPFSSDLSTNSDALFIGTSQGQLAKLNKKNGAMIWTIDVPSTVIAAPTANGSVVLVKTIDSELNAYSAITGKLLWTYRPETVFLQLHDASNPVIAGNQTIVGFADGRLTSLNLADGQTKWLKRISDPKGKTTVERMIDVDTTPIVENGMIYTANYQGNIVAIDTRDGMALWKHDLSDYNNLAQSSNILYATDSHGYVWALTKSAGRVLWKMDLLQHRKLSSPAYANYNVVVGDAEGYVHFISAKDGHFTARVRTGSSVTAAPLVNGNTVYVLTDNGELIAYAIS